VAAVTGSAAGGRCGGRYFDELEELEELEEDPPLPSSDELELLLEVLELLVELDDELEAVDEEDVADDRLEEEDVASVGLDPPQPDKTPTPASAAPPDSRIRNSRLSVRASTPSRSRFFATQRPPPFREKAGF
jgi:hypothetical protein